MYLIKQMALAKDLESAFVARDGIHMHVSEKNKKLLSVWGFWGDAECFWGDNFDLSILPKTEFVPGVRLTYANSYEVKNVGDGFKKIDFFADEYKPDEIEGYILFADKVIADISTNGEVIGGRYGNEIVVVLREGQELKFTEPEYYGGEVKTAKVVNGRLLLTTVK